MFRLFRALFFGAFALLALIPLAILLAAVGLPIVAVLAVLCAPVLLVLFLVGLPLLIVFAVVAGLLGATFGVLMAFLSVGIVALKIAIVVLVPVLLLTWIARRVFRPVSS
jgi:hypothetical protein